MDSLLSYLLSIILTSHALSEMKSEKILFSRLPTECAAEYDPFLRKERKAVSTDVIRVDLDGDGKNEMLVWTGNGGSSGEEWSVMRYNGSKYIRTGQVFGRLFALPSSQFRGLLVCTPCGWDQASWSFYQLQAGKLKQIIEFEIHYSKPIRKHPSEIKIIYGAGRKQEENKI